jgi:hypothetical protein
MAQTLYKKALGFWTNKNILEAFVVTIFKQLKPFGPSFFD